MIASGYGLVVCFSQKSFGLISKLITAVFIGLLMVLTIRTSVRANYINYDTGLEYLVYAHSAEGPKDILAQVEEISQRTVGGLDIKVAYDNKGLYPFWWYFRNFPNKVYFADSPTKDILNSPIIIAGEDNWSKVEGLTKNDYVMYEYMRMVWPNMDYFNLTWNRLWYVVSNPDMRQAVFNIWFNRDYTLYAKQTNNTSLTASTWSPSEKLRMYIRKDVVDQIWNYGVTPSAPSVAEVDPYASKMIDVQPDKIIGQTGTGQGQFNAPRAMAMSLDGSIYVADSRNNRIQHIAANGTVLQVWGTFGSIQQGNADPGTFNEPWGVAVGPDSSVYVADTWNYRIQKFTNDGVFLNMWNTYGDISSPTGFYGPRGVVVNADGQVFVTDTGNKYVVIFDADGKYLGQFGGSGFDLGQFDEPVGLSFDSTGNLYVADTWNQRVQVFAPNTVGIGYSPIYSWDVKAWSGQSVENKPFLVLDSNNNVFITDPDGYRVLEFSKDGSYLRGWGSYSPAMDGFGLPSGIAVDASNGVWVSDAGNNVLLHFTLPELPTTAPSTSLPIYPPSNVTLIYNTETGMLYTPDGLAVYQLDLAMGQWVPIVPLDIMSQIPAGAQPIKDATNIWTLFDANEIAIYRWDYASMQWLPVQ
jgi:sugar lactone lactonase YvrE